MKRRLLIALSVLTVAACRFAWLDTSRKDSTSCDDLLHADEAWARVVERKDITAYMTFVAHDARFVVDGQILGREQIRAMMSRIFDTPDSSIWSKAKSVTVSLSGDLGHTVGDFRFRSTDAAGRPTEFTGTYVDIWQRDARGHWKVLVDVASTAPSL